MFSFSFFLSECFLIHLFLFNWFAFINLFYFFIFQFFVSVNRSATIFSLLWIPLNVFMESSISNQFKCFIYSYVSGGQALKKTMPDCFIWNKKKSKKSDHKSYYIKHLCNMYLTLIHVNTYEYKGSSKECSACGQNNVVFLLFIIVVFFPITFWLWQLIVTSWWSNIFIMAMWWHTGLNGRN